MKTNCGPLARAQSCIFSSPTPTHLRHGTMAGASRLSATVFQWCLLLSILLQAASAERAEPFNGAVHPDPSDNDPAADDGMTVHPKPYVAL